ncbi:DUF481 domain-containing protein [Terriglobus sp. RCC_193]|uniref:DUF481 domain-containing protein n=1 Tax=Terriglobus sp. RCC_193 TaxID=3239218 RepID=UPI003524CACD
MVINVLGNGRLMRCAALSGDKRLHAVCRSFRIWSVIFIIVVFATPAFASNRQKNDTITLKNGDMITCEIRSLEKGELTIKQPNATSTVVLDWKSIATLQSKQSFVVIDNHGRTFSGTIHQDSIDSMLVVEGVASASVPHGLVVSIQETDARFFRSWRGDIDLGMNFAQSNSQKQATLQGNLFSQTVKRVIGVTVSTQFTSQLETSNTRQTDIKTEYFAQLRRTRWAAGGIANFLSSSAQKINLRTSLGAALAMRPIISNKTDLTFIGGVAYTIENDSSAAASPRSNSLDSAWAMQYSTFRFDSTDFDTTVWVYPSLTQGGRVRMTLNQDVYVKFYKDFYVRGSFYDNYDNRPTVSAPTNNLGTSLTVGWSFR